MSAHFSQDRAPAYQIDGEDCSREAFYALACDPNRHVVVQACAGAGKTWMLVSRIVRALLQGIPAHEILAITFTKKAAGEMRARLQEWLFEFAHADDGTLAQELISRGISREIASKPASDMRKQLSNLYHLVLSEGRGVQIRTFHSWFAALLRNAPLATLEALQLPAHYSLLEQDSEAVTLVWRRFYDMLDKDDALHDVYREAVASAGRSNTEKALENALSKRVEFALADTGGTGSVVANSIHSFTQEFTDFAGLEHPLEMLSIRLEHRQTLVDAAVYLERASQSSFSAKGVEMQAALTRLDYPGVFIALLTQKDEPRKFSEKIPGIALIRQAQTLCIRVQEALAQHEAYLHQQRMARLLRALIACLGDVKRDNAWVDMGDIERAAAYLLSDPVLSGWVQQRLDSTTRQVLIDEFQDTNPLQWQALHAWLSGYVGSGGGASGGHVPGVFIVGDPKQSIYRFRRAEPQVFMTAMAFIYEGLQGNVLSCDHTRRNAHAVLAATNGVMQQAADLGYDGFRWHTTESDNPGSVLRLPQVQRPEKQATDLRMRWRDTLSEPRVEAQDKLHTLECRQAARWIAMHIASGVEPGAIMVLARKRDRLQRMQSELQAVGIASSVSEKTQLMAHCEVQDVVALVDALVSPGNDLALARALKSPLFGLHDDDLLAMAAAARQLRCSWWDALSKTQLPAHELQGLWPDLSLYKAWFDELPPHDALAAVYHHRGVLARFMAAAPAPMRTGVAANLQALLSAALDTDGGRFVTPYAWVRALKSNTVSAPGQGAVLCDGVALYTVHGAKGLEAHTVLLLDTDAELEKPRSMDVLIDWPAASALPTLFAFVASESRPPRSVLAAMQAEQAARAREETNALYVAMTRAQNTLVLSSCAPHSANALSPWQHFAQLDASLVHDVAMLESNFQADNSAQALETAQTVSAEPFYMQIMPEISVEYAQTAIKNIADLITTTPSPQFVVHAETPRQTVQAEPDNDASRIGQAMHRLLELYAPGRALESLAGAVGAQFALNATQCAQALQSAQRITQGEAAWVWDSAQIDWQANEVELIAGGQLLRIDRLVRHRASQTWWVLDYKSSHAPQHDAALREQLATYRAAVQSANPTDVVKSAFITGQGEWRVL